MPAAVNKTELLAVTEKEYAKLAALCETVEEAQALIKDEAQTSIKDVVAHRAHWIWLYLGWYTDGQAGREVFFPAKGYKWNNLKRYNAELREAQAGLSWADARADLMQRHDELVGFLERLGDTELYGGPMKGARNAWTTGRWAEAAGASHYRSAVKYIRARLRAA